MTKSGTESGIESGVASKNASIGSRIFSLRRREGILFLVALVVLWQVVSMMPLRSAYLFPSPAVTAKALWGSMPELLRGTWSSFLILIPGYALAVAFGVVWGLVAGTRPWAERMFGPFSRFASPIPPTIYIPYAIALLPTFGAAASFVVFVAAFWPVFLNTATGAAALPLIYRDNARIIGVGVVRYLVRIVFPASLPHIFAGMSIGLVLSFIMLTVAELFGASSGLGRFVQLYADYADYPRMVAGILYTGIVVLIVMQVFDALRKRALHWMR
ncbi:MAG: ABC transporter permease subunit [Acidobacteriota bacterium]|jgi:NitT/TauT family transport system permease protein|nr:ABC transporter permease subunit [Acidobacteriota bacterium]